MGHLGSGVQRPRPRDDLPVHQLRRAGPRPEAGPRAEHGHRSLRDRACRPVHAARGGREPRCACAPSARSAAMAITMRSTITPQRVLDGTTMRWSQNYMAHHQGMSIVAVANAIFEGRMRDRFHSDPVIEAAELLLQEKAPRDIPVATVRTEVSERGNLPGGGERRFAPRPQSGARAALDQPHVERPLHRDGDRAAAPATAAGTIWRSRAGAPIRPRIATACSCSSRTSTPATGGPPPSSRSGWRARQAFTHFSDDKATFTKTVGKHPHRGRVHRRLGRQWRGPAHHHQQRWRHAIATSR